MLFEPELFDTPLFEDADLQILTSPNIVFNVGKARVGLQPERFSAPNKDPDAALDYEMNWAEWLRHGEHVTAAEVLPGDDALTVEAVTNLADAVRWRVSGGVPRGNYGLTVRITTNLGQIDDRSVRLRIRGR